MKLSAYPTKYFNGSRTVSMYLNDIRKYKVPTPEEELELFDAIKRGVKRAKDKLINSHQRFIYALAKIYAKNEDEVLDYVNEGVIGMMEAVNEYKPEYGFKFITFAQNYIKRRMNYYLNVINEPIRKSNALKIGKKADKIRDKFFVENGRYPTDEEVREILRKEYKISVKDMSDLYDCRVVSLNTCCDPENDSESFEGSKEYNEKTASTLEYETASNKTHMQSALRDALACLPEKNKEMIKLLFGVGYERAYTVAEVGEKFNLSEEDVVAIQKKTLQYIKDCNARKLAKVI